MLRRFFSVVPKTVQIWAAVLAGCAPLMGLIAGYETSERGAAAWTMPALGGGAFLHLTPRAHDTDGFFAAVLERAE